MFSSADTAAFQHLLDDAVAKGAAPGFQCVVFDRDSLLFNGVSGLASAPTTEAPEGKVLKKDSLLWIASCSKISMSLIVLHIIESGLAKSGFSMKDLDSHEALIKVLPEFEHGSGSLVTRIIEGFEDELGKDGKKIMKLRDAKGRVTLRMLLTHTAGMAYSWNHPLLAELYFPSDGSVPNFAMFAGSGDIRDCEVPLVNEPNSTYHYGSACDWLGQFAVRSSGRTLRELHKEIIFEPLGIPPSEADIWISPTLSEARAPIHRRDSNNNWEPIVFEVYATEGRPPEGKSYFASGCIVSSLQAYAKVLQAVLNQDTRILSKELWQMAIQDDLKTRGFTVPRPLWKSIAPQVASDSEEFAKSTVVNGAGVNLLQCNIALAPTVSGRPAGSFAWAGIANTYYFVDPINGVGAIFGTQVLPFYQTQLVEMRDKLEKMVYGTLGGE